MPTTNPPCYQNGADSPRRKVGCRGTCEAWREWEVQHEKEREEKWQKKQDYMRAEAFFGDRPHRSRLCQNAQSADRKKRGIKKI